MLLVPGFLLLVLERQTTSTQQLAAFSLRSFSEEGQQQ